MAIFTAWAYETHEAFGPIQKSANAAEKQVTAMQGQLDEMKAQRLINIANSRANPVRKISVRATTEGGILAYVGESIIGF